MCAIPIPLFWLSFSELGISAGFDSHGPGDVEGFEEVSEDVIMPFLLSQVYSTVAYFLHSLLTHHLQRIC